MEVTYMNMVDIIFLIFPQLAKVVVLGAGVKSEYRTYQTNFGNQHLLSQSRGLCTCFMPLLL